MTQLLWVWALLKSCSPKYFEKNCLCVSTFLLHTLFWLFPLFLHIRSSTIFPVLIIGYDWVIKISQFWDKTTLFFPILSAPVPVPKSRKKSLPSEYGICRTWVMSVTTSRHDLYGANWDVKAQSVNNFKGYKFYYTVEAESWWGESAYNIIQFFFDNYETYTIIFPVYFSSINLLKDCITILRHHAFDWTKLDLCLAFQAFFSSEGYETRETTR